MWNARFIRQSNLAAFAVAAVLFFGAFPAAAATPYCGCLITQNGEASCDSLNVADDATAEASCNGLCQQQGEQAGDASPQVFFDADASSASGDAKRQECAAAEQSVAPGASEPGAPSRPFVTPQLSFNVPGLAFTPILDKNGTLEVNFIADYVTAVYRVLLGVSVTIAIVMIMIGGFQYVISPATGDVKAAKERIRNAVVGLVLLLSVYVILFTINPQLTLFNALQVQYVPPVLIDSEDTGTVTPSSAAVQFAAPTGDNITGPGIGQVSVANAPAVSAAASVLKAQGFGMIITSSFRTIDEQKAAMAKYCGNPPVQSQCTRPVCFITDDNPGSCPHTSGNAVDIMASRVGSLNTQCFQNCATDKASRDECRKDPCQAALIAAMRQQGFCNLASEPWHFERPRMSSTCN